MTKVENQNPKDQVDKQILKDSAKRAGAWIAAATIAIGAPAAINSSKAPEGPVKASGTEQEQTDPRYIVQKGDTVEEVAEENLEERDSKQAFSAEPTESHIDTREMEIIAETNNEFPNQQITDPDEIKPGQVLVIPEATEVPIVVVPESDQRPSAGPTEPQN